jgi:hypothetical protein
MNSRPLPIEPWTIDAYTHPGSNGAEGYMQHMNVFNALQPAKRSPTPSSHASRSSVSRLTSLFTSTSASTSPPDYRESHPTTVLSPRRLQPVLMASVRNESNSNGRAIQQRQPNGVAKHSTSHRCNECPKSYSHAKNLREHKAKHRNERYFCDICGDSVAEKRNLSRHKRLKHGIRDAVKASPLQRITHGPEERS